MSEAEGPCWICAPLGACMTPSECFPTSGRFRDVSREYAFPTPTETDPPT